MKPEQIALLRKAAESLRAAELLATNELIDLKPEQIALLRKAAESLRAAELLATNELFDFAASRAYYTIRFR